MAPKRSTALLTTLGPALVAATLAIFAPAPTTSGTAEAASGSCSGVSLRPAARTVRRGGRALLEGQACEGANHASPGASGRVEVELRRHRKWTRVASSPIDSDGSFAVCARVNVPRRSKVAKLRATAPGGVTGSTTLRVSRRGSSGCADGDSGSSADDTYKPPPPEQGNPSCPLSQTGSAIGITLPSACTQLVSDTASNGDPIPFWGKLDCANASRHQQITSGADPHLTGTGTAQPDSSFRRMTAVDGDDVWGERCEAGLNDQGGPTVLFHEGQRRVTYASVRLPQSSPVGNPNWRVVLQMKQTQPYYNPYGGSMFELQARDGQWLIVNDWNDVWTAPAQQNTWTRFAFDMVYSQDPSIGSIKTYVDLNGDGDFGDPNEQSPRFQRQTLKPELAGGASPVPVGQSIPSHLRAGIYQNSNYNCPSGCSVDIDNVQVFRP